MALLSAPLVVSAQDTTAKTKQTDTSKTSGTTSTTGTATSGAAMTGGTATGTGTTTLPSAKAGAQGTADASAKPAKLKAEELQVMAHYHEVNLMEIDINKVAAKKATSEGAKAYANMLVKDHTAANNKLLALAKKTGQKIPAEKPASDIEKQEKAEDKKLIAKLKTMKGADFERQYLQLMVAVHDKELAKIDANIAKVENAELAESLRAKKPVLQHHADEARTLQSNAGGVSSTGTGTGTGATGTATGTTSGTMKSGSTTGIGTTGTVTGTTGSQARTGTGTATGTSTAGTAKTGTTTGTSTGTAKTGTTGTSTSTTGTTGTTKTGTTGTSTGSTNPTNTTTGTTSGAQKAPPPTHQH